MRIGCGALTSIDIQTNAAYVRTVQALDIDKVGIDSRSNVNTLSL